MLIQKRKKMGGDMEPCFKKLFLESTNSDNIKVSLVKKNSEKEKLHLSGLFFTYYHFVNR